MNLIDARPELNWPIIINLFKTCKVIPESIKYPTGNAAGLSLNPEPSPEHNQTGLTKAGNFF